MKQGLHWIHKTDTEFRYCCAGHKHYWEGFLAKGMNEVRFIKLLTSYIGFLYKVQSINHFSLDRQNLMDMAMCMHFFIPAVFWKNGMRSVFLSFKINLYISNFVFLMYVECRHLINLFCACFQVILCMFWICMEQKSGDDKYWLFSL